MRALQLRERKAREDKLQTVSQSLHLLRALQLDLTDPQERREAEQVAIPPPFEGIATELLPEFRDFIYRELSQSLHLLRALQPYLLKSLKIKGFGLRIVRN